MAEDNPTFDQPDPAKALEHVEKAQSHVDALQKDLLGPRPATQKPTKGRIVMYVRGPQELMNEADLTLPAMIIRVHNERTVNLLVFCEYEAYGIVHRAYISLDETPNHGTWHWPPRV